jgi:hypothetical protein
MKSCHGGWQRKRRCPLSFAAGCDLDAASDKRLSQVADLVIIYPASHSWLLVTTVGSITKEI